MWNKNQLVKMRRNIHFAVETLPDTDAIETPELFPVWAENTPYEIGYRVQYGDHLYKCVQSHTSQADWTPDATPALWTEVARPGEIPVWRQPTGAQDAYNTGDLVHYPDENGPVYISTIDGNVWSPDVTGWNLYEAG